MYPVSDNHRSRYPFKRYDSVRTEDLACNKDVYPVSTITGQGTLSSCICLSEYYSDRGKSCVLCHGISLTWYLLLSILSIRLCYRPHWIQFIQNQCTPSPRTLCFTCDISSPTFGDLCLSIVAIVQRCIRVWSRRPLPIDLKSISSGTDLHFKQLHTSHLISFEGLVLQHISISAHRAMPLLHHPFSECFGRGRSAYVITWAVKSCPRTPSDREWAYAISSHFWS